MIKAIQTFYKGYHFRSRTEARWAVFFDALGWAWQYEVEGFVLGEGTRYLPDFYFPDINAYAEVKGAAFTPEEVSKCVELSKKGCHVIMLDGPPDGKSYAAFDNGEEICQVIFIAKGEKYYPLFYGYDFEDYFDSTQAAINISRSTRFEFKN